MRILIVEDDIKIAGLLKKGLEDQGYAVDHLADGESAEKRIVLHFSDYNLIVLDLMLPRKSGFEVCRSIRDKNISTPLLVLTARSGTEDKVSVLNLGADDYLVKPFSFAELLARVRALERRPKQSLPSELKVADLSLDPVAKRVKRSGKEIKLTLKEFRLLEFLMRNAGQVVQREQIVSSLWDFDFDSFSNVVDVHINNLRKKIDRGKKQKLLESVRGVGYRLKK